MLELNADFESHYIDGFAREGGSAYFKAPLISHVEGNLWQGGCIDGVELPDGVEYVVSLYPWGQYILPEGCHRDEIEMYDQGKLPDLEQLHEIADKVNEYRAKGTTLVHCQAGLNRSGLVSALALHKSGMKAADAIALLREKRSRLVLCNGAFRNYLLSLDEA